MQRAITILCDSLLYPFETVLQIEFDFPSKLSGSLVPQHSKGATWQVNEDGIILH